MAHYRSPRPAPRLLLALVVAALALAACGSGGTGSTQPAPAGGVDGDWVLTAGTSPAGPLTPVDGSPVTLTVKGTAVGGRAACNSYSGDVTTSGGGFRPGSIAMTEMACTDPAVSTLERRYLDAFAAVTTATTGDDRLLLTGDGVELTFGRQAAVADAALEGTRWVLDTAFAGETASTVVEGAFLRLDAGALSGHGGCRSLAGAYRVEGGTLTVTGLTFPDDAVADCAAQESYALDDALRAFLSGPVTASVQGTRLTLMRGGTGYGFTSAP